ncbi:MAG: DMT family transporter [Acetobacteraceae bacterium]|nr:DMT family transporter [Acetobacteraceae bacterium]MSP29693.1 DMT family transporter [Acetobacteraceae bacterium]
MRTRRLEMNFLRSSNLFVPNLSFFFAISFIPMGKATSINMVSPIFVAVLAWPTLGERTNIGRVLAVLAGFIGVLVITCPGTEVFHWGALFIIFSALTNAFYRIFTRQVSDTEAPKTSAMYGPVVGSLGMLVILPFVWTTPSEWTDIALLCSLSIIGTISHYFVSKALGFAPANIVTPFQYVRLIGPAAVGFVLFRYFPDALTWIGAEIVFASGLYVVWIQTRRRT